MEDIGIACYDKAQLLKVIQDTLNHADTALLYKGRPTDITSIPENNLFEIVNRTMLIKFAATKKGRSIELFAVYKIVAQNNLKTDYVNKSERYLKRRGCISAGINAVMCQRVYPEASMESKTQTKPNKTKSNKTKSNKTKSNNKPTSKNRTVRFNTRTAKPW
jgi:hypothetical protein